jgi:hypothetical protein
MKTISAFALATIVVVLGGAASGQQPKADSEARSLVHKIVASMGGEAAVSRVDGTRSTATRYGKTAHGDAVVTVDQVTKYPDRLWILTKAPQFESTTVMTPADSFTIMAGSVRDLPDATRQEAVVSIKLGVISVAKHARDPQLQLCNKG